MNLVRKTFGFAQFILVIFVLTFSAQAAGEVDTSFLAGLTRTDFGRVDRILVQPDGKALVGGFFRTSGSFARAGLVRLNADSTVDASFQPPEFFNATGIGGGINAIALQPDGKILVGGDFIGATGFPLRGIMRLNTDGAIDSSFISPLNNGGSVLDIIVMADNDVLIAGNFTINDTGGNRSGMTRLNPNGTLDSFIFQNIATNITKLLVQTDGKVVAGSPTNIRRFNADGIFDPAYTTVTTNGSVLDMQLLPDGKILTAGVFSQINGFNLRGLFRMNADGGVDTTYNPGGANPNGSVWGIEPAAGGKFLIFGNFTTYNGVLRKQTAMINADGTLDTSFNNYTAHNFGTINQMAILPDGKMLVGGPSSGSTTLQPALARINSDATADGSFAGSVGTFGAAYTVRVQPDNKIIVGGQFTSAGGVSRGSIARFNADGSLDTTFTPPSIPISSAIYELELQPDGKIIVPVWNSVTYRLNANGTTDLTISTANARDAKYLPDGKFLIANGDRVRRYNSNGTVDGTFTSPLTNSSDEIYKLAVLPDGKIIVVGTFTTIGGQARGRIARLNADGTLDTTFNPPGGANANIHTAVVQSDGKILIGGAFTGVNFDLNKQYLVRLNADASLDTSFAPVLNAPVLGLKLQANGKILIAGAMSSVNGAFRPRIARINTDGSLDTSFNAGTGANSTVWSIDLQNDKIVYAGQFSATNGFSTLGVGRLLNAAVPVRTLFDYDGDGRADVSVFRSSTNRWYEILSGNSSVVEQTFGLAGDIVAPADYDGDGKTDIAIFRPASGDWWYLSSINNAQVQTHWGGAGDIPRPSDFDGDGKADFVVFRSAENNWYRFGSTGAVSIVNFGLAGDKPVTGDFDGDGKSDVAIFRPSTGTWWYRSSVNNAQIATQFGISSDIPTAADFDGDGKTDFAVYRASTGTWYILNSSNGQATILNFGLTEDKPVAADYDGDGKADIAVFRPSTGIWYQMRSTNGFLAIQFGISTDIPTENAFVP